MPDRDCTPKDICKHSFNKENAIALLCWKHHPPQKCVGTLGYNVRAVELFKLNFLSVWQSLLTRMSKNTIRAKRRLIQYHL